MINFSEISEKAYRYCADNKNESEVSNFITDSFFASYYCTEIEDKPEVRKYITTDRDCIFYKQCKYWGLIYD